MKKRISIQILVLSTLVFLFGVDTVRAVAEYQPLVGLPQLQGGSSSTGGTGLVGYFNRLYMVTVAVGAILAFLKITWAGVQYSLTEIVTDKSDAEHEIQGALLGLIILLIPFVVLNTIYPNLTDLNILENAQNVKVQLNGQGVQGASQPPSVKDPQLQPGEAKKSCSHDRTAVYGSPTDEIQAGAAQYTYDSAKCEKECSDLKGRYIKNSDDTAGVCAYTPEKTECSPTPETPCS